MRFSLIVRQMTCLFYIVMFLSSCVLGVLSNDTKKKTCCPRVSKAPVQGQIEVCAHVSGRKNAFGKVLCHEAYVLIMENRKKHCISLNAPWINGTLDELKQKGTPCKGTSK